MGVGEERGYYVLELDSVRSKWAPQKRYTQHLACMTIGVITVHTPSSMSKLQDKEKPEFLTMVRSLRVAAGLKQSQVADRIGVAVSTYGNIECTPHKIVSVDKVKKLAQFYQLDQPDTDRLIAAWSELPISEYSAKQRERWAKQNSKRGKARAYDRLRLSVVELAGALVTELGEDACTCLPEGGTAQDPNQACEFCEVLEQVGAGKWTTLAEVSERLVDLQSRLEAERDARVAYAANFRPNAVES